jgi:hypothetical protein
LCKSLHEDQEENIKEVNTKRTNTNQARQNARVTEASRSTLNILHLEVRERVLSDAKSRAIAATMRALHSQSGLTESVGETLREGTIHNILLGEGEGVDSG